LYTNIACKWDDDQFEKFLDCLKITGNLKVYEMLSACLTKSQIGFLKEEMITAHFHKSGFTKDVEDAGIALANYYESGSLFSGEKFL